MCGSYFLSKFNVIERKVSYNFHVFPADTAQVYVSFQTSAGPFIVPSVSIMIFGSEPNY